MSSKWDSVEQPRGQRIQVVAGFVLQVRPTCSWRSAFATFPEERRGLIRASLDKHRRFRKWDSHLWTFILPCPRHWVLVLPFGSWSWAIAAVAPVGPIPKSKRIGQNQKRKDQANCYNYFKIHLSFVQQAVSSHLTVRKEIARRNTRTWSVFALLPPCPESECGDCIQRIGVASQAARMASTTCAPPFYGHGQFVNGKLLKIRLNTD